MIPLLVWRCETTMWRTRTTMQVWSTAWSLSKFSLGTFHDPCGQSGRMLWLAWLPDPESLCSVPIFVFGSIICGSVTHIIIGASYFLCCVSLTHIEKRLTRSRLPPRVKKPGANCKYYLLFSVYVESCKLIIANICDLLRAKVANRWHLPQSRGATPRSPSVPSSPSFVLFVVVVVVVVFFLIYGGMRALERRGEIWQGRRDAPRRRQWHPAAPPCDPAFDNSVKSSGR